MTKSKGPLLSPEEQAICEQVIDTGESPHSQRAKALSAINKGMTQVKAGELAGLTLGQVRYCLQRFRQIRVSLFPIDQSHQQTQGESNTEGSTRLFNKSEDKKKKKKQRKKKDKKNRDKKGKDKKQNKKNKDKNKDRKKDKKLKAKSGKKRIKDKTVKSKKSRKNKKEKKKSGKSKK